MFDLELLDTSLQGEVDGPRSDEHERLMRASEQLRKGLAESGKFQLLDIAPMMPRRRGSNLQACGGCDVQLRRSWVPTWPSQVWCRRFRTSF